MRGPRDPATWPFECVDKARFDRLGQVQRGRVEQVLINILDQIEASKPRGHRPANARLVWSATGTRPTGSRELRDEARACPLRVVRAVHERETEPGVST